MKSKIAILTGSTGDIGYSILKILLKNNYKAIVTYNNKKKIRRISNLKNVFPFKVDLSKIKDIENFTKKIKTKFPKIDAIINNAGILIEKKIENIRPAEWDHLMNVNLKAPFFIIQYLIKRLNYGSSIINVSSVGGQIGGTKSIHYATSKAGLISLSKSFSKILSNKRIRVNSISPGYINTRMHANKDKKKISKIIPLKKFGSTEDVANLVLFIISDKSKYINGANINIDGGYINII